MSESVKATVERTVSSRVDLLMSRPIWDRWNIWDGTWGQIDDALVLSPLEVHRE